MVTMLCVATYLKGEAFLQECRRQGATVLLLTNDKLADAAWPREAIDEIHTVPRDASDARVKAAVDGIARRHRVDRIAACARMLRGPQIDVASDPRRLPGRGDRRDAP